MPGGPGILFDPSVSWRRSRSSIRTPCAARTPRLLGSGCFPRAFLVCFPGFFSPKWGGVSGLVARFVSFAFSGLMARFFWVSGSGRFLGFGFRGGVAAWVLFSVVFWFWFGLCCSLAFLHLF